MDRIKYFLIAMLLVSAPAAFVGCSDDDDEQIGSVTDPSDLSYVDFELPASMVGTVSDGLTFTVNEERAPLASDVMMLEGTDGVSYECPVKAVDSHSFTVSIPKELPTGEYRVFIKRADRKRPFGKTTIQIVDRIVTPAEGSTIFGIVTNTAGEGVKGVLISDGAEIVATDDEGIYQLASKKAIGCVFMITPSGYEPSTDGVLPLIYQVTKLPEQTPERVDFKINPVPSQDNYKVLFMGDMHLANRTGDIGQFKKVMEDLQSYRTEHSSEKVYGITLGDMTWDLYWYDNKFDLGNYVETINENVKDITIYHTMGNHDNDMLTTNNLDSKKPYRNHVAPNYYSFNIGKVHYVVLDDIDCSTYDGTSSRNYKQLVTPDQINWLKKDLSYVDKATPVIITMHAPLYYPSGATGFRYDLNDYNGLLEAIAGYKVHFVTGHTHKNYNVIPSSSIVGGRDIHEHNVAAICSDWWWSGNLTPGCLMAPDGTPSGYAIWDINGTDFKYIYKTAGMDESHQFRAYDLNKVSFTHEKDVPLTGAFKDFEKYCNAYPENKNNEVLINVWNYNPKWTVTVTTKDGKTLTPTAVQAYDPLHIAAMTVKRFNKESVKSAPSFITQDFCHFFKVKAPDADVDLIITVKDEFGHTWTETMERPKAFSIDAYKIK